LNIKDLITRAGAGITYILFVLIGVLGGKYSFLVVFGIILALGLYEFYRMVEKDTEHYISKVFNIVSGLVIYVSAFFFMEGLNVYFFSATILIYLLILFTSGICIKRHDILHSIINSAFGQLYITLPMCLLMLIGYQYNLFNDDFHHALILAIFVMIWVNDTAAYFFGTLIGKHRFVEHISPKKTTEGLIAGLFFTIIAGLIFAHFYPQYPIGFWIGFAAIASVFGTVGDLFESLIKRTYKIKDSGHLLPGHGGILDRIDSLLIEIPAIFFYLMTFTIFA
jgi:phosphatidate cytidylyltransferase